MKPIITFLDAATVDLGDIDITFLKKQGTYRTHANLNFNDIGIQASDSEIVIANKFLINEAFLNKMPKLKLVCIAATGANNVDWEALKKRKIALCNVAGYSTQTVAEHTLLFMLVLAHRLPEHQKAAIDGTWAKSTFFGCLNYPFSDLAGKTLGLIGSGTIGKQVARLAKAFGMKVLLAQIPGRPLSDKKIPLKTVLKKSDYVSVHCPLSSLTQNLINEKTLSLFKKGAFLINVARGPIVDEAAVAKALAANQLAGYAADVVTKEPISLDNPLLCPSINSKIILTPHVAWASKESRQRLINEIALNIDYFLKGKKRNRLV